MLRGANRRSAPNATVFNQPYGMSILAVQAAANPIAERLRAGALIHQIVSAPLKGQS